MSASKIGLLLFIPLSLLSFFDLETTDTLNVDGKEATIVDSTSSGKQLALRYCGSCHQFPEPELLDTKTWVTSVLPNMGRRLGIRQPGQDTLKALSPEEEKAISQLNIYPQTAVLSLDDWNQLVSYYEHTAPAEPLPQKSHLSITNQLPLFKAKEVSPGDKPVPQTTLLAYDKTTANSTWAMRNRRCMS